MDDKSLGKLTPLNAVLVRKAPVKVPATKSSPNKQTQAIALPVSERERSRQNIGVGIAGSGREGARTLLVRESVSSRPFVTRMQKILTKNVEPN